MTPSKEEIAKRAFDIWVREGKQSGKDSDNWYRAEAELCSLQKDPQLTSKDPAIMKAPKQRKVSAGSQPGRNSKP